MDILRDYVLDEDWKQCSNGKYVFATKEKNKYFIKTFMRPKYPRTGSLSPKVVAAKKAECDAWEQKQRDLLKKLKGLAGSSGNLVVPIDFFREDTSYYKVSLKIDMSTLMPTEIASLSSDDQLLLLKTMVGSVGTLHRANIVHGDLKPDNILISKSESGKLVTKIIDFDDSYLEKKPPRAEETIGTPVYYSPELAKYIIEESDVLGENITCKSDVFAMGIIFHEYITGSRPANSSLPKAKAYEVVHEGKELKLNSEISEDMGILLKRMLLEDPNARPDCTEILSELKKIKDIKKTPRKCRIPVVLTKKATILKRTIDSFVPTPIASTEGEGEVLRIIQLTPTNFRVEYEGGKFRTVPLMYIKQNKLENRVEK